MPSPSGMSWLDVTHHSFRLPLPIAWSAERCTGLYRNPGNLGVDNPNPSLEGRSRPLPLPCFPTGLQVKFSLAQGNGGWGGPTTLTSKFGVEGGPHCSVFSYDPGSVAAATSPLGLRKMGAAAGTTSTPRLGMPPPMVCHWLSVAVNVPHNAQCCHFFSPECIYLFHTSTETHTQCWHISVSTHQPASSVSSCLKSKFRNRS